MQKDSLFLNDIWRTMRTVLEMMVDRKMPICEDYSGFLLDGNHVDENGSLILPTLEEFKDKVLHQDLSERDIREKLILVGKKSNGDRTSVMWIGPPSLTNHTIKHHCEKMEELNLTHSIFIVKTKITTYAEAAIRNLKLNKIQIETFYDQELKINVTKHENVPRHIVCGPDKKQQILDTYAVAKENIPIIRSTDPVARYLGATKWQLIKVVRENLTFPYVKIKETPQKLYYISYRIVI